MRLAANTSACRIAVVASASNPNNRVPL